ncbi:hypothetical protein [Sphingomonas sp.]|uniref:hypothetical protein n=1 Tax=Sphingomonas sp. TaxID=28214 RepID=UPI00325FB939
MGRRARSSRDMSMEEFEQWCAATDAVKQTLEATAEEGGPRVSLVPIPASVPLDILPDEVEVPATLVPGELRAVPFDPEPSRKTGGWSADRQRSFIEVLAETGSIHVAARSAGLSARSAYSLRVRSAAFAAAWDGAQMLAVGRLSAIAFDRAIHGRIEQVYHKGDLIGERRVPSEKLLMWLLARLDPNRFAAPWERRIGDDSNPQAAVHGAFPALLAALRDTAEE